MRSKSVQICSVVAVLTILATINTSYGEIVSNVNDLSGIVSGSGVDPATSTSDIVKDNQSPCDNGKISQQTDALTDSTLKLPLQQATTIEERTKFGTGGNSGNSGKPSIHIIIPNTNGHGGTYPTKPTYSPYPHYPYPSYPYPPHSHPHSTTAPTTPAPTGTPTQPPFHHHHSPHRYPYYPYYYPHYYPTYPMYPGFPYYPHYHHHHHNGYGSTMDTDTGESSIGSRQNNEFVPFTDYQISPASNGDSEINYITSESDFLQAADQLANDNSRRTSKNNHRSVLGSAPFRNIFGLGKF